MQKLTCRSIEWRIPKLRQHNYNQLTFKIKEAKLKKDNEIFMCFFVFALKNCVKKIGYIHTEE